MQEVNHILWLLPTAIGAFGVKFLRDLSLAVNKLNTHIEVLVTRVDSHEDKISDHEERLRDVEVVTRHAG